VKVTTSSYGVVFRELNFQTENRIKICLKPSEIYFQFIQGTKKITIKLSAICLEFQDKIKEMLLEFLIRHCFCLLALELGILQLLLLLCGDIEKNPGPVSEFLDPGV
jgi:hypothetical protein